MNKRTLLLLLGFIFLCHSLMSCSEKSATEPLLELSFAEKLQQALDTGIQEYHGKGISAAVIMPDGEIWKGVSGISHGNIPVTTDMLFSAGSITKNFTAVTILQLAEEGVLSLDDPLYEWLPVYPNIDRTITIRQLLNHTNGIFNVTEHPAIWPVILSDPFRIWTLEEMLSTFTLPPYFPKGTDWHYSNTGYMLLRMIIREASGSRVSEQYRTRFFEVFDLSRAYLSPEEVLPANTATGWFDLNGDHQYDELTLLLSINSGVGGVVFCTAEDLAKWSRALFHDKRVLTENSFNQMMTFHSPCPEAPLVDGYGLGVINFAPELFNNMQVHGHSGNAPGYAAGSFYLPALGVAIGIMDNTEEGDAMYVINDLLSIITSELE